MKKENLKKLISNVTFTPKRIFLFIVIPILFIVVFIFLFKCESHIDRDAVKEQETLEKEIEKHTEKIEVIEKEIEKNIEKSEELIKETKLKIKTNTTNDRLNNLQDMGIIKIKKKGK